MKKEAVEPTNRELAEGILEGRCVRHDHDLVVDGSEWATCPVSKATAKAWTNVTEIVVEINDVLGHHTILIPLGLVP